AALWLIGQVKPAVALLEVGLGGRLDAVNIVDADVAIITTLGIDHVDWLGDDIEQIGREKAGVARPGRPLVCGEYEPPQSIAQLCADEGILLYQAKRDFTIERDAQSWQWRGIGMQGQAVHYTSLPLPSLPLQNAGTALQALSLLGLPCSEEAIGKGLCRAQVAGRQQRFEYAGTSVLLDVAHNPQSAAYLARSLGEHSVQRDVQIVLGVLADKDSVALVEALKPLVAHWHLVTLNVPRGQSATQLKQALLDNQIDSATITCHDNMADALQGAVEGGDEQGRVLVAGSFFTISDALAVIEEAGAA
ncbi:MAG: bifunctional folylpolyglutamate synthase/dihydrofolate synthase, partial [Pseudomonadales bacterium]